MSFDFSLVGFVRQSEASAFGSLRSSACILSATVECC